MVVEDKLWIGTFEHGLDIMDLKTGKIVRRYIAGPTDEDLKSNFPVALLRTRNGTIYIGTSNGMNVYDPKKDKFPRPEGGADWGFVAALFEDHEGTIWVSTHNRGIIYFNPQTKKSGQYINDPQNPNSLTTVNINAVFEDSYHNIWVATEGGGLCRLNKDKQNFTRYTTKDGLPSNFIFKILEDNDRNLWITTSKGLVSMNTQKGSLMVYTKANGLLNDQFNYYSGYKDASGRLYFGSVRGLITFKPDDFSKTLFTPPVVITGFQVHNTELDAATDTSILKKSIVHTNSITLPYDQSSFSLDFASVSFTSPEMTEYSYIMEGLDKEWTYLKSNRKVYFTNLEPGSYTFKVRAGNKGHWSKEVRTLQINITPPFWATRWAYLVYALLILLFLYYVITTYHDIHESRKEKEIYEAKFEFFTNIAHEIKTPLTLIKGPVENLSEIVHHVPEIKEDIVIMERNTNRLVNLINQILDFRQTETKGFSLDFATVNLNELLQEAYLTFEPLAKKKAIHYNLSLPSETIYTKADGEALNKIFSNLFSNAVKYGDKEVSVLLYAPTKDTDFLRIEFKNDGFLIPDDLREKIFEPFYRLKETIKQKGTGIGLALARSLVELHEGKLYLEKSGEDCNNFILELPYISSVKKKKEEEPTAMLKTV